MEEPLQRLIDCLPLATEVRSHKLQTFPHVLQRLRLDTQKLVRRISKEPGAPELIFGQFSEEEEEEEQSVTICQKQNDEKKFWF